METDDDYRKSVEVAWLHHSNMPGNEGVLSRKQYWDSRHPIVARMLMEALRESMEGTERKSEQAGMALRAMFAEMEMGFDHWKATLNGAKIPSRELIGGPRDLAKIACRVAESWELTPDAAVYDDEGVWVRYSHNATFQSTGLRILYASAFSQLYLSSLTRWWLCGLPTIVPGAKLTASLLATDMPAELQSAVKSPWPSFVIAVPEGLIKMQIPGHAGLDDVKVIHVFSILGRGELKCGYFASSNASDVCLNTTCTTWERVIGDIEGGSLVLTEENGEPTWRVAVGLDEICSSADTRAHSLIRRLIAGCILSLSDPGRVDRPIVHVTREAPPAGAIGDPENPKLAVYRLGGAVRVDLRKEIREYSMGVRGTMPHARTLVRGHWKRQAIGKRHKDHKIMHIEPYWRGDVPIAMTKPREFVIEA